MPAHQRLAFVPAVHVKGLIRILLPQSYTLWHARLCFKAVIIFTAKKKQNTVPISHLSTPIPRTKSELILVQKREPAQGTCHETADTILWLFPRDQDERSPGPIPMTTLSSRPFNILTARNKQFGSPDRTKGKIVLGKKESTISFDQSVYLFFGRKAT